MGSVVVGQAINNTLHATLTHLHDKEEEDMDVMSVTEQI